MTFLTSKLRTYIWLYLIKIYTGLGDVNTYDYFMEVGTRWQEGLYLMEVCTLVRDSLTYGFILNDLRQSY